MKKISLAILLSLNGGYVDTVGFLALGGLFTAHVTGNLVTFGAAVVHGTGGGVAKLLALPVFCIIVFLSRAAGLFLIRAGYSAERPLLSVVLGLLILAMGIAFELGPFVSADSGAALAVGMCLVAAMAIQNGLHRTYLAKFPPTTMMTGTTTQIMLDLADLAVGPRGQQQLPVQNRLKQMSLTVFVFAVGCALATTAFTSSAVWCFAPPIIFSSLAFLAGFEAPEGETSTIEPRSIL